MSQKSSPFHALNWYDWAITFDQADLDAVILDWPLLRAEIIERLGRPPEFSIRHLSRRSYVRQYIDQLDHTPTRDILVYVLNHSETAPRQKYLINWCARKSKIPVRVDEALLASCGVFLLAQEPSPDL